MYDSGVRFIRFYLLDTGNSLGLCSLGRDTTGEGKGCVWMLLMLHLTPLFLSMKHLHVPVLHR